MVSVTATSAIGALASRSTAGPGTSTALSPEQLARMRALFGLDEPLHVQYVTWLGSLLRGDAGALGDGSREAHERD